MSQPTPYTPTTDFSQQEANNASGRSTVNTAALDAEFANIELTLDQTLTNIQQIQRDDGKLKDLVCEVHALSPEVLNLICGFRIPGNGTWQPSTAYQVNDLASDANSNYVCITAHTSGASFDASKWARFGFTAGTDIAASLAAAQASATAAANSATTASNAATSAGNSATSATASASAASASATSASGSASAASASASAAENSAAYAASGAFAVTTVGAHRNLKASANGTSANVSVTADELVVEDSSNRYQVVRNVSLTINTAGEGANGLDTGTLSTSTWYAVWVIYNGSTTKGLISLSSSSPTLPSGYTYAARVGWIRTDGAANKYPLAFKQYGRKVRYTPISGSNLTYFPTMASAVAGTALAAGSVTWSSAIGTTSFFPSTAAFITAIAINAGYVALSDSTLYVGIYGSAAAPFAGSSNNTGDRCIGEFPYTANLYVAGNSGQPNVHAIGWEDNI